MNPTTIGCIGQSTRNAELSPDFARYYSVCEDSGRRFTWLGYTEWKRRQERNRRAQAHTGGV
jgi:hypothetical protein